MLLTEIKKSLDLNPGNCLNMADLRVEIDQLDQKIVEMITLRQSYMDQAAHIKQHRDQVRDDIRVVDVIKKVSNHALKTGADPELLANLYRFMIEWSINYEMGQFDMLTKRDRAG